MTYDLQLVKDVLTLSSLVEVNRDSVRPLKWSHYVLPNAKASVIGDPPVDVEQLVLQNPPPRSATDSSNVTLVSQAAPQPVTGDPPPRAESSDVLERVIGDHQEDEDEEEEEEEEDDVVFVLGKDANRDWMPELKTES